MLYSMAGDMTSTILAWDIARRYLRQVPRYTSYPTAPAWQPAGANVANQALKRATQNNNAISIYVHIPFCERMCLYCGCNMIASKSYDKVPRYLDALLREIRMVAAHLGKRELIQLHLGGGTPTFLTASDLERLISSIFEYFPPTANAELSIEIDPLVTSRIQLEVLRRLGFNRLSIGVQDFSDEIQKITGRNQSAIISRQAVSLGRELGFSSINIDLIYGLPKQTIDHIKMSTATCVELNVDRIALFGYAHLPHIKPHQKKLESYSIPNPERRWQMFAAGRYVLQSGNYQPIGMDHFALPIDELSIAARDGRLNRNFQGYTVLAPTDLIGLGVSAISDVGGCYIQNNHRIINYIEAIESNSFACERACILSNEDTVRRTVIASIMCNLMVNFRDIEQKFSLDFASHFASALNQLQSYEHDGLCLLQQNSLVVTELGRPLVRNIAMAFDAYAKNFVSAKFSSSI
ncbi:MAG: oxygen-independent coproporphyrinogen III oxidase [Deltaproteobacteria bacterium]|nr:oxygen-independent coproporphyrinogen III oxidase [Deltaproteobacteria bacterium]